MWGSRITGILMGIIMRTVAQGQRTAFVSRATNNFGAQGPRNALGNVAVNGA